MLRRAAVDLFHIIPTDGFHLRDLVGHGGGEVVFLAVIGPDVEQFHFAGVELAHEFEVADDEGADRRMIVAGVVVDDARGRSADFSAVALLEQLPQTAAFDTFRHRCLAPAKVVKSGKEVPLHDRDITLGTGLDSGTGNDGGDTNAPFEDGAFPVLQWTVKAALFPIDFDLPGVPSPVVGGEDEVGVIQLALGLECINQSADVHVHFLDHGGVQDVPVHAGFFGVDLLGVSPFSDPPLLRPFKDFLGRHVRNVGGVVVDHDEERLLAGVSIDESHGVLAERMEALGVVRREGGLQFWVPIGAMTIAVATGFPRQFVGDVVAGVLEPPRELAPLPNIAVT